MKIGIVGAGIAGLTAAWDLAKAGHQVVVYEAAAQAGGLSSGFRDPSWDWPLERFYHHLFEGDAAMRELVAEIGFADKLFFRAPITAQWWRGRGYAMSGGAAPLGMPLPAALTSSLAVLSFPALPVLDRFRLGAVIAYLKYGIRDWRPLERATAAAWSRRTLGNTVYRDFIHPLLEGKFGPYAEEVNMAWLWARFKSRSFRLGYFVGGFQGFCDALLAAVQRAGVKVALGAPIAAVAPLPEGAWRVTPAGAAEPADVDALIVTGSPQLLGKLAPQLPSSYLADLRQLRSLGAVVLTIALNQPLTDGLYWVNMPKDQFPFLALVEHTNFVESQHYGGDHLIYCGDYLDPSHEYFQLTKDELLARFMPALQKINPRFQSAWVRDSWLHREPYAQPIVTVDHSRRIPPLATPLPGLFWASMSQVYPWDRGTNYAVELGHRVASTVLAETAYQIPSP